MSVELRPLIGKLNETTRSALEAAAGLCLSRTHYDVEIEHFLLKLMDATNADLAAILKYFEIDRARLSRHGPSARSITAPVRSVPDLRSWLSLLKLS